MCAQSGTTAHPETTRGRRYARRPHGRSGRRPLLVRRQGLPRHGGPPQRLDLEGASSEDKYVASDVVNMMEKWFLLFGHPLRIRTDGGPQFRGPFRDFCDTHDIVHEASSPYNPQSNGLAESAVKASKTLLDKNNGHYENFKKALSAYNDLPRSDGIAPSDLMLHRRKRGPAPLPTMQKRISGDALTRKETKSDYVLNHNKNAAGKKYTLFAPGTPVIVQHPITKR